MVPCFGNRPENTPRSPFGARHSSPRSGDPRVRCTLLVALVMLVSVARVWASDVLVLQRADPVSGEEVVLRAEGDVVAVVWPGGAKTEVATGDGFVTSFAVAGREGEKRFWVAGSRPASDSGARGELSLDELFLLVGDEGAQRPLRLPGHTSGTARARFEPVVLVANGTLVGLAWLEGSDPQRLEVWAAAVRSPAADSEESTDPVFERPVRVAAAARGTQTGLDGAVLDDGSWLLAWSAFDGQDDEIRVAVRTRGLWQAAQNLTDNQVPDIRPRVATTTSGVAVAWSGFVREENAAAPSSGYRLHLARRLLAVMVWDTEELPALGAHRLSWSGPPSSRRLLSYRSWPRQWSLAELDGTAQVTRTALIETDLRETPVVRLVAGDPTLLWSAEQSATAGWAPVR